MSIYSKFSSILAIFVERERIFLLVSLSCKKRKSPTSGFLNFFNLGKIEVYVPSVPLFILTKPKSPPE